MNIFDYLDWRGDLSFSAAPFNEVDALICAWMSYYDFGRLVELGQELNGMSLREMTDFHEKNIGEFKEVNLTTTVIPEMTANWLVYRASHTVRFESLRLWDFWEKSSQEKNVQFAAISFVIEGVKRIVAYRGTDTSIAGWREDCELSFSDAVPAQLLAQAYLDGLSDDLPMVLCGHSKGGNLAVYAVLHAADISIARVELVYNFDGPGFCFDVLNMERYQEIRERIITIVPESSIIGLLLEHEEEYLIVKSQMVSILQHDAVFWKVQGNHFVYTDELSATSAAFDKTFYRWIKAVTPEERKEFINAVFTVLESTGVEHFTEIGESGEAMLRSGIKMLQSLTTLSGEQKKMAIKLLIEMFKASNATLTETVANSRFVTDIAESLTENSNYIASVVDKGRNKLGSLLAKGKGLFESKQQNKPALPSVSGKKGGKE